MATDIRCFFAAPQDIKCAKIRNQAVEDLAEMYALTADLQR